MALTDTFVKTVRPVKAARHKYSDGDGIFSSMRGMTVNYGSACSLKFLWPDKHVAVTARSGWILCFLTNPSE
jgi:hypothetical protein